MIDDVRFEVVAYYRPVQEDHGESRQERFTLVIYDELEIAQAIAEALGNVSKVVKVTMQVTRTKQEDLLTVVYEEVEDINDSGLDT